MSVNVFLMFHYLDLLRENGQFLVDLLGENSFTIPSRVVFSEYEHGKMIELRVL
jgi:hypothetical protein